VEFWCQNSIQMWRWFSIFFSHQLGCYTKVEEFIAQAEKYKEEQWFATQSRICADRIYINRENRQF